MYYFISFASEDKDVKENIRKILFKNDIKYWTDDSEIMLTEKIDKKINEAIDNTTSAIVIISKNYFKTEGLYSWCKHELARILKKAIKTNYNILPVFIEPIELIKKNLSEDDQILLSDLAKYHGVKLFEFEGNLGIKHIEEFLIQQEKKLNPHFEDKDGYFGYWGIEFGQQGRFNQVYNYLNIDIVHSDKGREYVVIGKFELLSQKRRDKSYNEEYHNIAMRYLKDYINEKKQEFSIIFSDKNVLRKEFTIFKENEKILVYFTGRVAGVYPFNINIAINYSEILLYI